MTKLQHRRLKYLADQMAKLPNGAHEHRFSGSLKVKDLHECGTSACAFGWACAMPYFKKLGIKWDHDTGRVTVLPEDETVFGPDALRLFYDKTITTPKDWAAAARKFLRGHKPT